MHYHPSIIKGEPFAGPSGRPGETIVYIPYSFGTPERHCFIRNLASASDSKIRDHPQRRALASLLRQLRRNGFRYVALYGIENDPVRFLDRLRQKGYTLEVHGRLFDFHSERGYVDFHGNVCEYSAAFLYRIYSRELFQNIIDRLRTVKRHQAWQN